MINAYNALSMFSLLEYANRYAPQPAPIDFTVRFTPYD
jgi:hypothetical protein